MSATISAVRDCARTLLLDCLRIDAFQGATPHVMLVVDRSPCVQQKALVEGYRQVMEELNGTLPHGAEAAAAAGSLYIPLDPSVSAPCGASGLTADAAAPPPVMSYSIAPFNAGTFMQDMQRLQAFLRLCGESADGNDANDPSPVSPLEFQQRFLEVAPYLLPLPADYADEELTRRNAADGALVASTPLSFSGSSDNDGKRVAEVCAALRSGGRRELLGFILIQRNAFQNELRQYRLRLALFNMGVRVAEHCHLESMSERADGLAAMGGAGCYREAIEDDQVYSYARSCAFPPRLAETLGKAIADSIDLQSWARDSGAAGGDALTSVPPPPAYRACIDNDAVWKLLKSGTLSWSGGGGGSDGDDDGTDSLETALRRPITGAGAPLRIVSRDLSGAAADEGHVLTFSGGMEDCLMNTGYYIAAEQPERNDVDTHRTRFPNHVEEGEEEEEVQPAAAAAGEEVRGRLKKKEYLALLKAQGKKPNKPSRADNDSDADERDENTRARPAAGCDVATGGCSGDGARSATASAAGNCIGNSIGGTFPIGEVISESFDLSQLNGTCRVFAYPGQFKQVTMAEPQPFEMTIKKGCVTAVGEGCPAEFVDLLSLVRQAEGGRCHVRELGIGLNPFTGRQHVLADVTSFERQWGVHLSLGQRHPLFVKQKARRNPDGSVAVGVTVEGPVLKRKAGKYHIDVFVDAARLEMGQLAVDFTKGVVVA